MSSKVHFPLTVFCFALLLISCQRNEEPRVYEEITKKAPESPPLLMDDPHAFMRAPSPERFEGSQADASLTETMLAQTSSPNFLTWEVPAGWIEQKGTGLRLATFVPENKVERFECSIVSLGGDAGGLKANVIRWMNQMKMAVLADEALDQFLSRQEQINLGRDLKVQVIDFASLQEEMPMDAPSMLAAVIETGEKVFFIKLTGSKEVVIKNREYFKALCRSMKLSE